MSEPDKLRLRAEVRIRNAEMIDARKRFGFSQIVLAKHVGVPHADVARFEKLDYRIYDVKTKAAKLAFALELPIEKILVPGMEDKCFPADQVTYQAVEVAKLIRQGQEERFLLPSPEDVAIAAEEKQVIAVEIAHALVTLTPEQQKVIKLYFGFDGSRPHSFTEIGKIIDRSNQTARDRVMKGLRCLSGPLGDKLKSAGILDAPKSTRYIPNI